MTLMYGLTSKSLFASAGAIAAERYPNGCPDADLLAGIVREVIAAARDSGSHAKHENARSAVEPEGWQSGAAKTAHRPNNPLNTTAYHRSQGEGESIAPMLRLIDLEHDIDLALALRKASRPRFQERARKGWATRRGK